MSQLFEALQIAEGEKTGAPLSQIPAIATELLQPGERGDRVLDAVPVVHISPSPGGRLLSLTEEHSLAAEKFRFLAVRLRQIQQTRPIKRVLITSTMAEEGKSFVAANLAITLARKRQKILLIEGDLRRPGLVEPFGLGKLPGLSECLTGEKNPSQAIFRLEEARLWFMPAGCPLENPLELMQSSRLAELLTQISSWFDWVVIDSPPVLPLADTVVWTRVTDGTLIVAREGRTEESALKRGLQALGKANLLGAVLNSCSDVDHNNYYQRYGTPPAPGANGSNGA